MSLLVVFLQPTTKMVSPSEVHCYGTDPVQHTIYTGSDEAYHYFIWSKGLRNGEWRVSIGELKLEGSFPHRSAQQFVFRDESGKLGLVGLGEAEENAAEDVGTP